MNFLIWGCGLCASMLVRSTHSTVSCSWLRKYRR